MEFEESDDKTAFTSLSPHLNIGVANGTQKIVDLENFWSDLEISATFATSHEVSFFMCFFRSRIFFGRSRSLGFASLAEVLRQRLSRCWESRVSFAEGTKLWERDWLLYIHSARAHAFLIRFPMTITMRMLWCWNRTKTWAVGFNFSRLRTSNWI